ncbi:MAG: hypothetical protein EA362_11410 [Saprospirales bacterium]|nr:MAG: hypothetical protein EA362_11410 [Saprospirales bacterium]
MKILIQKIDTNVQSTIKCFLYNTSQYQFSTDITVEGFSSSVIYKKTSFLNPKEIREVFRSFFHHMNHYPIIHYSATPYSTMGPEKPVKGTIKLKAKDFIKKSSYVDVLNDRAVSVNLEIHKEISVKSKSKIAYRLKDEKKSDLKKVKLFNTEELVEFNPTIDLHLHNLVEDVSKVKSGMAVLIQLAAFNKHLEKAIRLGIDRIFVIHGVGEGKLKKTVINTAKNNPMVKEVKNEYHPKFGFGATEILI